jgi:hypothetical protein
MKRHFEESQPTEPRAKRARQDDPHEPAAPLPALHRVPAEMLEIDLANRTMQYMGALNVRFSCRWPASRLIVFSFPSPFKLSDPISLRLSLSDLA